MLRRLRDQEGAFSVVALLALGVVIVPLILLMLDASRASNAASQATGMSYNLAYTAVNRAVNVEDTQTTGVPRLKYYGANGGEVEAETAQVMTMQAQMAALAGSGASYALSPSSAALNRTGAMPYTRAPLVGLVNVTVDNREAAQVDAVCPSTPGSVGMFGTALVCWNDQRPRVSAARASYRHFSSGAQVRVAFQVPSIFGTLLPGRGVDSTLSGVRTGVALLARPCKSPEDRAAQDCAL